MRVGYYYFIFVMAIIQRVLYISNMSRACI
jgi:hypothetical protein